MFDLDKSLNLFYHVKPVGGWQPILGSPTTGIAWSIREKTPIIIGVKLTFVVVVFFGHVQLLRFVIVKNFWSCSNPNFGHIYLVM